MSTSIITSIRLVLELLPIIIQTVKQLEEIFPEDGFGPLKFNLIVKTLQETQDVSNELVPIVERLINLVVSTFNAFDVFGNDKTQ